jgi:hypothetical protein
MSQINTNSIDVNYPIPGQNNSSQGFRTNFTSIKNNLDTAGNEITELQNNAVLKSALSGITLNNDMANTLISNAAVRSFRHTTYNLGNSLSGTVVVDSSVADYNYGNVSGNITLQFSSWAPTNTSQTIILQLGNLTGKTITFPTAVSYTNDNAGLTLLENYQGSGVVSAPFNTDQLTFALSTVDCGNTLYIEPLYRSQQSSQIVKRAPPVTGQQGDRVGTVCVDTALDQLVITNTNAADYLTTSGNTTQLYPGMAVSFTGTSFEANIVIGTTYYVRNVVSSTTFTISSTSAISSNLDLSTASGTMYCNPVSYMYIATDNYSGNTFDKNIGSTTAPSTITISSAMSNVAVNQPIIFTGTVGGNTGVSVDSVFYIKTVVGSAITVSQTRYNGVAGPTYTGVLTTSGATTDIDCTVYEGPDIFKRVTLNPY